MKKHSKILIGLAVSAPLAAIAIATPLALTSNQAISNSVAGDTTSENINNGLSNQVVFNSCEFEMINPSETNSANEVKITLKGQNLDLIEKQDLKIVNKTTGVEYLADNISSLDYYPSTSSLEARLIASDIQVGTYEVTYAPATASTHDSSTSIEGFISPTTPPVFAAENSRVWFNWGDTIKLQLMGGGSLLDLTKTSIKINLENKNVDITSKFDASVSGVYLNLSMKDGSDIALNADTKLTVTLGNINGTDKNSSKKVGIFSKTKTVVKGVETIFGQDNKVTLTISGQSLPTDDENVPKKLVILKWDNSVAGVAATATYETANFKVKKEGSTSEKLILEGTFKDATKDNCRFDVRVK